MEAEMNVAKESHNVEATRSEGDLELPKNAVGNKVVRTLVCPKDVLSNFTVEAALEEDYRVRMGFMDDYVCAFCDDGGSLIWCEGECGRLFHPAKPDGVHSKCETLGLSKEQVETSVFLCKNCEYKKHQCVVCGGLGSSDTSSDFKFVEVFQCNKKGCKRFYHPECMEGDYNKRPEDFECPLHECWSCKNEGREVAGKQATPECNERRIQRRGRKARKMNAEEEQGDPVQITGLTPRLPDRPQPPPDLAGQGTSMGATPSSTTPPAGYPQAPARKSRTAPRSRPPTSSREEPPGYASPAHHQSRGWAPPPPPGREAAAARMAADGGGRRRTRVPPESLGRGATREGSGFGSGPCPLSRAGSVPRRPWAAPMGHRLGGARQRISPLYLPAEKRIWKRAKGPA